MTPPPSSLPEKESSVLFSLNELMDLENERLADEEEARAAEARAIERAREREEEQRRYEERARLEALEEERRVAELRKREEAARLEAIHRGEVEKARAAAENEARLRMVAQSHEHEERLQAIQQDQAKKKLRVLVGASLAAALLIGVAGAFWVQETRRQAEAELARMAAQAEADSRALDIQIAELTREMNIVGAKDAEAREKMKQEILELKRQRDQNVAPGKPPKPHVKPPRSNGSTKPPSPPKCENEWDPMCGGLD